MEVVELIFFVEVGIAGLILIHVIRHWNRNK
jgi:hypothetical protein